MNSRRPASDPLGVDRGKIHQLIGNAALRFYDASLNVPRGKYTPCHNRVSLVVGQRYTWFVSRFPQLLPQRQGVISRPKGATYYFEASYGLSPEFAEFVANHPAQIDRASATGRVLLERKIVHVPDVLADPEYTYAARGDDWRGHSLTGKLS
jgi:hypothetical protein